MISDQQIRKDLDRTTDKQIRNVVIFFAALFSILLAVS